MAPTTTKRAGSFPFHLTFTAVFYIAFIKYLIPLPFSLVMQYYKSPLQDLPASFSFNSPERFFFSHQETWHHTQDVLKKSASSIPLCTHGGGYSSVPPLCIQVLVIAVVSCNFLSTEIGLGYCLLSYLYGPFKTGIRIAILCHSLVLRPF